MAVTSNVVLYAAWTPLATTTTTVPELQVLIPTNPTPTDNHITFPDKLPKTGVDLSGEVLAAFFIGLATLALAFWRQLRSLVTTHRRVARRDR